MKKELKWEVWEDNGGGLHLFVFNKKGRVIYADSGYEYDDGLLLGLIAMIKDGANPQKDQWESVYYKEDYQAFYEELVGELIADNDDNYPERMGVAGRREFRFD